MAGYAHIAQQLPTPIICSISTIEAITSTATSNQRPKKHIKAPTKRRYNRGTVLDSEVGLQFIKEGGGKEAILAYAARRGRANKQKCAWRAAFAPPVRSPWRHICPSRSQKWSNWSQARAAALNLRSLILPSSFEKKETRTLFSHCLRTAAAVDQHPVSALTLIFGSFYVDMSKPLSQEQHKNLDCLLHQSTISKTIIVRESAIHVKPGAKTTRYDIRNKD